MIDGLSRPVHEKNQRLQRWRMGFSCRAIDRTFCKFIKFKSITVLKSNWLWERLETSYWVTGGITGNLKLKLERGENRGKRREE